MTPRSDENLHCQISSRWNLLRFSTKDQHFQNDTNTFKTTPPSETASWLGVIPLLFKGINILRTSFFLAAERRKSLATVEGRGVLSAFGMSRGAERESFAALRLMRLEIQYHGLWPWLSLRRSAAKNSIKCRRDASGILTAFSRRGGCATNKVAPFLRRSRARSASPAGRRINDG
jgi:hypothetical protein